MLVERFAQKWLILKGIFDSFLESQWQWAVHVQQRSARMLHTCGWCPPPLSPRHWVASATCIHTDDYFYLPLVYIIYRLMTKLQTKEMAEIFERCRLDVTISLLSLHVSAGELYDSMGLFSRSDTSEIYLVGGSDFHLSIYSGINPCILYTWSGP